MRRRINIEGAVQGVGFRPFVFRLAAELRLGGWIINSPQGVTIEAEGDPTMLDWLLQRLKTEKPPQSIINQLTCEDIPAQGERRFEIHHSSAAGSKTALVLPDLAICPDCRTELFDPLNRRYRYPFINCTHCGPRYTIIQSLPYDRPATTMSRFEMCPECRREYEDPMDRRFHAQPNACPVCGPHVELWDPAGNVLSTHGAALHDAVQAIQRGEIVAVKGLGGFHLMVSAQNRKAVQRLRDRKHRSEKPFAIMAPSLEWTHSVCAVSELEAALLTSIEAPIVLLRRLNSRDWVCDEVAPGTPYLGVMLPYTPLHCLLMADLGAPVVATSGNLSDEPICTDEQDALKRLAGIADLFLIHDRPIERHIDDSVVRVMAGQKMILRRARGYAPLPLHMPGGLPALVATGAHQKNTIAISAHQEVYIGQHVGDLETIAAFEASKQTLRSLTRLYDQTPVAAACDKHPDYLSTRHAESLGIPVYPIQHHYAHAVACLAEHHLKPPAFGIIWDGTGYGDDGTIWGGEFLTLTPDGYERTGHLYPFRLPGGETAVREPRRTALGLLFAIYGEDAPIYLPEALQPAFTEEELEIFMRMLKRELNSPVTTSAGRLFDGIAALMGIQPRVSYEGQAAMQLEFLIAPDEQPRTALPFRVQSDCGTFVMDWRPAVVRILSDLVRGTPNPEIAARFHNMLADLIVYAALQRGQDQILLSGGCFQNRILLENTVSRLQDQAFQVYWSQLFPPNDGGIALGQLMAAASQLKRQ